MKAGNSHAVPASAAVASDVQAGGAGTDSTADLDVVAGPLRVQLRIDDAAIRIFPDDSCGPQDRCCCLTQEAASTAVMAAALLKQLTRMQSVAAAAPAERTICCRRRLQGLQDLRVWNRGPADYGLEIVAASSR